MQHCGLLCDRLPVCGDFAGIVKREVFYDKERALRALFAKPRCQRVWKSATQQRSELAILSKVP